MCYSWKNPTKHEDEFDPYILDKLPSGMIRLNVTGGEPTIRDDILTILKILRPKARTLELSTNGYLIDKLMDIGKSFPDIRIRISVEGLSKTNDEIRGIKDGFDHALRGILQLRSLGLKDIGFATVISDRNIDDLKYIYQLCTALGIEFSQSTLHNSFYFFKDDNKIDDIELVTGRLREFIRDLLTSKRRDIRLRVKDWFRAYINAGLLRYIQGRERSISCGAASEFFFVDPSGRILACNGSPEPWVMGNLNSQGFDEIWHSERADYIRELVRNCKRNCWMTGSSVPAMRREIWKPVKWVLRNKLCIYLGKNVNEEI